MATRVQTFEKKLYPVSINDVRLISVVSLMERIPNRTWAMIAPLTTVHLRSCWREFGANRTIGGLDASDESPAVTCPYNVLLHHHQPPVCMYHEPSH